MNVYFHDDMKLTSGYIDAVVFEEFHFAATYSEKELTRKSSFYSSK